MPKSGRNTSEAGVVVSVNVGTPRTVEWFGRVVTTSIWKSPVAGPVMVAGINVAGDDQADRRVHGGPNMAVYAYTAEDYEWWSDQLGRLLPPGTFGENLTLSGVDLGAAVVGEVWEVGSAALRVTQPRIPCFKLGIRMGDGRFVKRFEAARRFGCYFAIDEPGTIGPGDPAARRARSDGDALTIADFINAYEDNEPVLLRRIADHPFIEESWRQHARSAMARLNGVSASDR
jgi:MOSC domain-containing protein YiiM